MKVDVIFEPTLEVLVERYGMIPNYYVPTRIEAARNSLRKFIVII